MYIIGSKEKRENWINENWIPWFEFENGIDDDLVELFDQDESTHNALIVNLNESPVLYTVQKFDAITGFGIVYEQDYTSYEDALKDYETELAA